MHGTSSRLNRPTADLVEYRCEAHNGFFHVIKFYTVDLRLDLGNTDERNRFRQSLYEMIVDFNLSASVKAYAIRP